MKTLIATFVIMTMLINTASANDQIQDGSIIFLKGGSRAISWYTKSSLTHAAIIFKDEGEWKVYEATYPVVRKISLVEYQKTFHTLNPFLKKAHRSFVQMCIGKPNKPYTSEEINKMKTYAERQLGKKYSLIGYFKDKDKEDKLHCTEYVTNILLWSGYKLSDFGVQTANKVQPAILWAKVSSNYSFAEWEYPPLPLSNLRKRLRRR